MKLSMTSILKEIVPDPKWLVDGSSRLDIVQGSLGNCWMLAATGSLAENKKVFKRVAPDQSFSDKYCGLFR